MIEPNWDYFIHAPLDEGVIRFETKTERALHAKVVAICRSLLNEIVCQIWIVDPWVDFVSLVDGHHCGTSISQIRVVYRYFTNLRISFAEMLRQIQRACWSRH